MRDDHQDGHPEAGDHHGAAAAIPVEMLGCDSFELGLLAVLRHFMSAYAKPESHAWQQAHGIAAQRWGEVEGPQIAYRLLAVIQTLRQQRRGDFRFANPLCLHCRGLCTPDEAAFCRMIHAMRRDRADLARLAIPDLTDGRIDPLLVQVALAFAASFPAEAEATGSATALTPGGRAAYLRRVH